MFKSYDNPMLYQKDPNKSVLKLQDRLPDISDSSRFWELAFCSVFINQFLHWKDMYIRTFFTELNIEGHVKLRQRFKNKGMSGFVIDL